jgi:4-amino-4-deoxy-L-arabinose transferase-like glycosyltransferase
MRINKLLVIIFLAGAFLRFFEVQNNPPGLYIDEVSIGVNAYEILKNGVDEHGAAYPIFFEAFGEYKMPFYVYLVSGVMALIGKSELAVRLPSVIAGILTIPLFYLFIKKLINTNPKTLPRRQAGEIRNSKQIQNTKKSLEIGNWKLEIPIVAAGLLALSPWHMHFSRAGFEANVALFLYLLGSYLTLLFLESKKNKYIFTAVLFFALTLYTYNAYRIISPLTAAAISIFLFLKLPNFRKKTVAMVLGFVLLILPVIQFSLTEAGATRFEDVSAFAEHEARSPREKMLIYPMEVFDNYISYFSFEFLFSHGDRNNRHQLPGFGLIWRFMFPFVLTGAFIVFRRGGNLLKTVLFFMLFVAPLPASIVVPNPHSLRSLLMVLPLAAFGAYGLSFVFNKFSKYRKVLFIGLGLIAIYEFSLFMHNYYFHYNKENSPDWGAGYKEMTVRVLDYKKEYDYLVIDKNLPDAPIYIKFYGENLGPVFVDTTWKKPDAWEGKKVLYIRPFYGETEGEYIIENIYLPGRDDIHAQFWSL